MTASSVDGLAESEIGEPAEFYDDQANGLDFDDGGKIGRFINNGTVQATGFKANGLYVDGSMFDYGIVNNGIIESDGVAIRVENFQINPDTLKVKVTTLVTIPRVWCR